jgi:hypothetical protein
MKNKLQILLLIGITVLKGQDAGEFFPGGLNIKPFAANYLEPKLGFLFNIDQSVRSNNQNTLELEIGNTIDVYKFTISENEFISIGADLFTYSRLRSEKNFKFPVETIDYLFGINAGYKSRSEFFQYGARFRFSHISAHLVDGLYRNGNFNCEQCVDWADKKPFVYSKEFIELMPFISYMDFRLYAGYTYNYNIKPAFLGKNGFQFGFDYYYQISSDTKIFPFAGYDLRITETTSYASNQTINAGLKFGKLQGKGISVYLIYYDGYSKHGEFWDQKINYSAIGFNLDL